MVPLPDRVNPSDEESVDSSLTWFGQRPFSRPAKALQPQQPKSLELLEPKPVVIVVTEALVLHAAHAPTNPAIQLPQGISPRKPTGGEGLSGASNHLVEFRNDRRLQVVRAASDLPHLVLKFPHGLGPHPPGPARQHEPQEGIAFPLGGDPSFLGA